MNRGALVLATAVLLAGCDKEVDLTARNWTATPEKCPESENAAALETRAVQDGMRAIKAKCIGTPELKDRAGLKAKHIDPNRTEFEGGGFVLNVGKQDSPYIEGRTSSFSTDTAALIEMQACVRGALKEAEEGTGCTIRVSETADETRTVEIE